MGMTRQRKLILDYLRRTDSHPSAVEVYDRVRKTLPRISLGTVYRNLETLRRQGLIRKVETYGGSRRFDGTVEDHLHVICTNCGKIRDVEAAAGIKQEVFKKVESDFRITGVKLDILGVCPECTQK
ncbi:MAG: Fur family transcriptional regulator [Thermodesulfobacteriota bacterium]